MRARGAWSPQTGGSLWSSRSRRGVRSESHMIDTLSLMDRRFQGEGDQSENGNMDEQ